MRRALSFGFKFRVQGWLLFGDRQPGAGARWLGGEEGLEDLILNLFYDPDPLSLIRIFECRMPSCLH